MKKISNNGFKTVKEETLFKRLTKMKLTKCQNEVSKNWSFNSNKGYVSRFPILTINKTDACFKQIISMLNTLNLTYEYIHISYKSDINKSAILISTKINETKY